MTIPTRPSAPTFTGTPPNRGQSEDDFNVNQQNFVDYQVTWASIVDTVTSWINTVAALVEGWAVDAEAATVLTAADVVATNAAKVDAQAAAAAAQAAAGLTPDPDFGMVLATTANTAVKTSAYTAIVGVMQDVDTSGGAFAITPPASPTVGQWFGVRDYNQGSFAGNFPWILYGTNKIIGRSENCYIDLNTVIFTWRGATKGWCL